MASLAVAEPRAPSAETIERLRRLSPSALLATEGYSVVITNREAVRTFFNNVYQASEDAAIMWTGDVASCSPGTTAAAFKEAVRLRINYYRAMAGVPSTVTFSDAFNSQAQLSALMTSTNGVLNHTPPMTFACWTADGAEAAENSNLALGNYGPKAIDSLFEDPGANNQAAGHRRWFLYPQTETMGTGDIPPNGSFKTANSTWIFDGNFGGPRPATRDTFVSWPPPGYVPYPVVYNRWSFSYPNADFSAATVSVTSNGVAVPVTLHPLAPNVGENTLVWHPNNLDPNAASNWPRPTTDVIDTVTINNVVISGVTNDFNYTVVVFDPARPGADTVLPVITGTSTPTLNQASGYTFLAVPDAMAYQWRVAPRSSLTAIEGAETGLTHFTTNITAGYAVIVNSPVANSSAAFHLAMPVAEDQSLTDTRHLLPGAGGQLQFKSRLGWAATGQVATVQASLDDGSSWQDIYSQAGTGTSGEGSFVTRTVSLTNFVGRSILIRFRYVHSGGSFFPQSTAGVGWYIDDISFSNVEELTQPITAATSGTAFTFTPTIATNFALLARAQLFEPYYAEWSAAKLVTAAATAGTNNPPTALCRNLTTNATANCQAAVLAAAINNGSSDPDGAALSLSLSPSGPYGLGSNVVMLTVTDDQNESDSCSATIVVIDSVAPTIACPSNIITNVPEGVTSAAVTFPAALASDNCLIASTNYVPASGSTFELGTNTVIRTAIDANGNSNTCQFSVIVQITPPGPPVAHDLAVLSIKAPKKVTLKGGLPPAKPGKVTVTILNHSDHPETIGNAAELLNLVTLTVTSLATNCSTPLVATGSAVFPVVIAPGKKLKLTYFVSIVCANDPLASSKTADHSDYRYLATVNHAAIDGQVDTVPANNVCPRPPSGNDPGCGGKDQVTGLLGAEIVTDAVVK